MGAPLAPTLGATASHRTGMAGLSAVSSTWLEGSAREALERSMRASVVSSGSRRSSRARARSVGAWKSSRARRLDRVLPRGCLRGGANHDHRPRRRDSTDDGDMKPWNASAVRDRFAPPPSLGPACSVRAHVRAPRAGERRSEPGCLPTERSGPLSSRFVCCRRDRVYPYFPGPTVPSLEPPSETTRTS